MYISYDSYRVFYYAAKYRSLTKAAEALLSNQPNVTRTIRCLEGGLGCKLFIRSNRGVALTPEGQRLFGHVKLAVEQLQAGEAELAAARDLKGGYVSISASEVALRCFLLPVLAGFRRRYPGIRLRVSNSSTPQAMSELRERRADLVLVTTPAGEARGLEVRQVKELFETAVCGPAFSSLAGRPVTLRELAALPIVSLGEGTGTYEFYSRLFREHGLEFAPAVEASTADQILPMVKNDLGVGFVPQEFLAGEPGILTIQLDREIPPRWVVMMKRGGEALSLAARELEAMVLRSIQQESPGSCAAGASSPV